MRRITAGLAGLVLLAAQPARADQVHFTGATTANQTLIKDTLQMILRYAYAESKCGTLSAVDATVLPDSYVPKDPKYNVGTGTVVRESWTATLCGQQTRFLVSFWRAADGGTDFALGVPYPDDGP